MNPLKISVGRNSSAASTTVDIFEAGDYAWTAYTPTTTGFGTPSGVSVQHKRVGDMLMVQGSWTNGTVTASDATISLPIGLQLDYTKLPNYSKWVGWAGQIPVGNASFLVGNQFRIFSDGSTSDKIYMASGYNSSSYVKAAGSAIVNSSPERFDFFFQVPISGWSTFPIGVARGGAVNCNVFLSGFSQKGSTNTRIPALTTTNQNVGSCFSSVVVNDATNGSSVTISTTGVYEISFCSIVNSGDAYSGISLNAATPITTAIDSLTYANGNRGFSSTPDAGHVTCHTKSLYLVNGDIVRPHTRGGNNYQNNIGTNFQVRLVTPQ
jgi:hypothetical protein